MTNQYYNPGGNPVANSSLVSANIRTEMTAIGQGFDKVAPLTGHANEVVMVNSGATAQTSTATPTVTGLTAGANGVLSAGPVTVRLSGATGGTQSITGDATHTGYYAFLNAAAGREGYIGSATTTGGSDTGTIPYVAGTHSFTGAMVVSGTLTASPIVGNLTGNVTGNVSGTAPAGTLTGTTLAANVVTSSLTSVGTLGSLAVTGTVTAGTFSGAGTSLTGTAAALSIGGNAATATLATTASAAPAGALTGTTLAANVVTSSLTSVGTLGSLTVTGTATAGTFSGAGTSLTGTAAALNVGGNAATATALQTARTINGTSFNGTANITVTAAAGTLTGATLAATVTASSLTSVGTLSTLSVTNGITAGTVLSVPSIALQGGAITFVGAGGGDLDWYEEGTFTPSIEFGGASTGQTGTFNGWFTRIGNTVQWAATISLTNKGSSTGSARIAGLPYAVGRTAVGGIMGQSWVGLTGAPVGYMNTGFAVMEINQTSATSSFGTVNETHFTAPANYFASGSYIV